MMRNSFLRTIQSTSHRVFSSQSQTNEIARHGYRKLLKAVKVAFKGDYTALMQGRVALRDEFEKNRHEHDPTLLKALYAGIDEAEEMLLFHIVQGKKSDDGKYGVSLTENHVTAIQHDQTHPFGPELSPIDTSVLGQEVKIHTVKNTSKKTTE